MNARVVVDVGNTRLKWGLCQDDAVVTLAALPPDDPQAWQRQYDAWRLDRTQPWIVSGVHPARRDALVAWLQEQGARVQRLDSWRDLPLEVAVDEPARVGIDRLLNAVAAQRRASACAAVAIDAGSAVTVDYVDRAGVFRGGAIYPGLRLMAHALHDYTALLPLVEVRHTAAPPATATAQAIETGILYAVIGGAERLVDELRRHDGGAVEVFLTGGDAPLLAESYRGPCTVWPEMTLAGILYSAASPR
jgi:type III pantothenate kinase